MFIYIYIIGVCAFVFFFLIPIVPILDWKWRDFVVREESELRSERCGCRYIH